MWSNLHTHLPYCDGKSEPADYLRAAKEQNVKSLGFSSHAPLPFPNKWCMKPDRLTEYIQTIQALKGKYPVEIYAGLEVDFIPEVTGPTDFSSQLDYTIGSIHFVDSLPEGTRWEIDGTHTFFLEGFEKIFQRNIRHAITRYFELTREMVATSCPDIVGHLDKIKIQNIGGTFFNEQDPWYQDQVKQTVDAIGRYGAIIEVNTRGLYQKKSTTPYPSPWVLEYIHQKKIPITISSDAHHADDLTNQFEPTAALLYAIGFRSVTVLLQGEWKAYPLTAHGISIN